MKNISGLKAQLGCVGTPQSQGQAPTGVVFLGKFPIQFLLHFCCCCQCSWQCHSLQLALLNVPLNSWACKPIQGALDHANHPANCRYWYCLIPVEWEPLRHRVQDQLLQSHLDVKNHSTRLFLQVTSLNKTSWNHARSLVLTSLAVCSFWCFQALLFIIINIKQAPWEALGAGLAGLSLHLTCKCSACAHIRPLAGSELSSFTHNWGALGGCGVCAQNTRATQNTGV